MQPLLIPQKNTNIIQIKADQYTFQPGDHIYFTIKTTPDNDQTDSDALAKVDWVVGTDADYDNEGYLALALSESDTNIDFGDYFYDIKLVNDEVKCTLVVGQVKILPVATLRA